MTTDVVILGLGYVGLPLAQASIGAGLRVTGLEVDAGIVDALNAGRSHVDDVSGDDVRGMLRGGFCATVDAAVVSRASTVVICVPTPLSGTDPDLSALRAAATTVGRGLRPDMLVLLESTSYPGTTEEVVLPLLEAESGLVAGSDFNLAFSPERIDPGNPSFRLKNTPKIVGGLTDECAERAAGFYELLVSTVVRVRGTREAEMAKLLENAYRHVNIAFVNEMAQLCRGLDIDFWDVVRAAASKPFGFQSFRPGVGVGGHCIPVDPHYLSHHVRNTLGYPARFVELAHEINATMPGYVARRAQDLLNEAGKAMNGAGVLLLGVSYKPNVRDSRQSPAAPLARRLSLLGAKVTYHDPRVIDWTPPDVVVCRAADLDSEVAAADLVILLQPHREYRTEHLASLARQFFDTCGVTDSPDVHRL